MVNTPRFFFRFNVLACLLLTISVFAEEWAPDYLIIGAQKSGTTVLYQFINTHPMAVKKGEETHFFDLQFDKWVSWYQSQFQPRSAVSTIIGDKSPYYLFHPQVPQRVHALYPNIKLIVILRNPIERAYSQYQMNFKGGQETLTFEQALDVEDDRLAGEFEMLVNNATYHSYNYQMFSYLARGRYAEQIKRWQAYFPLQQMLILTHDELATDPVGVMNLVFAFLGLPPHYDPIWHEHKQGGYRPMAVATRVRLKAYFSPLNNELEILIDRKICWE